VGHLARGQVDQDVRTGGQCALGGLPRPLVEQSVPDQAELLGPRVAVDHVAELVDDDDADRR
jgi:hypothetical protein